MSKWNEEAPVAVGVPEKTYAQFAWSLLQQPGGQDVIEFAKRWPNEWRSIFLSTHGFETNLSVLLRFMSTMAIRTYRVHRDARQAMLEMLVVPMQRGLAPLEEGLQNGPRFSQHREKEEHGDRGQYEVLDYYKLLMYVAGIGRRLSEDQDFNIDLPDGWAMRVRLVETEETVSYEDMPELGEMVIVHRFPRVEWIEPRAVLEQKLGSIHNFAQFDHQSWPRFRQAWGGDKRFLQIVEEDPAEEAVAAKEEGV